MTAAMQTRHLLLATAIASLIVAAPIAQAPAQQEQPQKAEQPKPEPALGQPVNIKLDFTITDQTGPGDPLRKVVTLVVADRHSGSIRSTGSVRSQGRVQINVDARPQILQSGTIRLSLGLEYNPRTLGNDSPTEWSSLNEQLGVVLQAGKPLVVSQAADPASDRRISVEVLASILK